MVIPKKHVKSIVEADEKTMLKVFKTVQLISNHYIKNCGFSGVNIVNNCGESAGQTVMHFHIHIFPRKQNDLGEVGWKQENISELKLDDLIKQLKYTKK